VASRPTETATSGLTNPLIRQHWKTLVANIPDSSQPSLFTLDPATAQDLALKWLEHASASRASERECRDCSAEGSLETLTCDRCFQEQERSTLFLQDNRDDSQDDDEKHEEELAADHVEELAALQEDCYDWRRRALAAERRLDEAQEEAEEAVDENVQWGMIKDRDADIDELEAKVKRLEEDLADATADNPRDPCGWGESPAAEEESAIETEEEPTEVDSDDYSSDDGIPFHYDDPHADADSRARPTKRARQVPPPADPSLSKEPLVPRRLFSSFLPVNAHCDQRRVPIGRVPLREVVSSGPGVPPFWLHARKTQFGLAREESEEDEEEVAEIYIKSEDDGDGDDVSDDEVDKGKERAVAVAEARKPGRGYNKRKAGEQPKRGLRKPVNSRR